MVEQTSLKKTYKEKNDKMEWQDFVWVSMCMEQKKMKIIIFLIMQYTNF